MLSIFIFLLGLAMGSFLNVVICRLDTKESIFRGRSHCPHCRAILKWYDLIPLLSFILQKGRCRYCHKKISLQYPLVELATGLLFLLLWDNPFYYLIIVCVLIVIFVYDLKHYLIPDKIILSAILFALIFNWSNILAALLASGFFLLIVLSTKGKGMGLGDVKLAFLMGLILGWPNIVMALFLAFVTGALVGLGLIMAGKKTIKSEIPFGPFLAGATIILMSVDNFLVVV